MVHENGVVAATVKPMAWVTLLSNDAYVPGAITLRYSLQRAGSQYPFVAMYVDGRVSQATLDKLQAAGIGLRKVPFLKPNYHEGYPNDRRFDECWTHCNAFSLTEYERVVLLDSDMICLGNPDELFDVHIPEGWMAAAHACVCNPAHKPHYPPDWRPENCAYTHQTKAEAFGKGGRSSDSLGFLNGGMQVIVPSLTIYRDLVNIIESEMVSTYAFADQELLSIYFKDKWVPLSYKFNALKTLRWCHSPIWEDKDVKILHYILMPKPWDDNRDPEADPTHEWWWKIEDERRALEASSK